MIHHCYSVLKWFNYLVCSVILVKKYGPLIQHIRIRYKPNLWHTCTAYKCSHMLFFLWDFIDVLFFFSCKAKWAFCSATFPLISEAVKNNNCYLKLYFFFVKKQLCLVLHSYLAKIKILINKVNKLYMYMDAF